MNLESDHLKRMIFFSAGLHFFFISCLFMLHYLKWSHPLVKPQVLSVQWITLPQAPPEIKKTAPPEPVKRREPLPAPQSQKRNPAPSKIRIQPAPKPEMSLPPPVLSTKKIEPLPLPQPVQPKVEPLPPAEAKKEEEPLPVEPQKVEIAPISAIDPTYVERVKRTVDMNWNPPTYSGNPKEVTISFEILKNGLVKNPKVVKSSKDAFFDMAALRAVFDSRRFGQLPPDYPSLSVEITCTFSQNKGS